MKEKEVAISDEQIVERMMFPMITESIRCLEEKIVATPMELDLALVYGIGFPPFRGGVLRYVDNVGIKTICDKMSFHRSCGECYQPTEMMLEMSKNNGIFYSLKQ